MGLFNFFNKTVTPSITKISGYRNICGIKNLNKQNMYTLQSIVIPESKKGTLTAEKIISTCDSIISNSLRIIDDCKKLISATENPRVFYERYELLIEKYIEIQRLESYIEIYGYSASESLLYYNNEKLKFEKKLIDRCYNKALIKADSLKTEKAKKNQFIKAYDNLCEYQTIMYPENVFYMNNKFKKKF